MESKYIRGDMSQADGKALLLGLQPPCECPDCEHQFRTIADQKRLIFRYRANLSYEEAEAMTTELVSHINRDLSYLRKKCSSHGNIIITRWKKKSREKREKILLAADPTMYLSQWLIPCHLFKFDTDEGWPKIRERHRNILLPYVTIPDLRDDSSKFLSLLLNRT